MEATTLQECYRDARQAIDSKAAANAIAICRHVLDYYPNAVQAHFLLGEGLALAGERDAAIEAYDRALEMDALHAWAHRGKGLVFSELGRLDEAVTELEMALELDPGIPKVRDDLARLYARTRAPERAKVNLRRAGLARLYVMGTLLMQAASEYRGVLESDPQRLDVKLSLAETLWKNGEREEAAELSRSILLQHPESMRAHLILAEVYFHSGREAEGQEHWQHVLEQDPEGQLAKEYLASAQLPADWLPFSGQHIELPACPSVEAATAPVVEPEVEPETIETAAPRVDEYVEAGPSAESAQAEVEQAVVAASEEVRAPEREPESVEVEPPPEKVGGVVEVYGGPEEITLKY
jgi:tetratricopeptide (TPR) repeat protein